MRSLVNTEDPDEMSHNVAFYQGLHCLLRQKRSSEEDIISEPWHEISNNLIF